MDTLARKGSIAGPSRLAAALAACLVLLASAASADPRACRQLEAQLAAVSGTGARSAGQAQRYERAMQTQQQQIRRAQDQARQAGCARGAQARAGSACAALDATLGRMHSNMAELQRAHAALSGGTAGRRERARLTAALDAAGCRTRQPSSSSITVRGTAPAQTTPGSGNLAGNLRTMCVRTCDGYYFPLSYGVSQTAFMRDEKSCAAMCPGTRVELHYHRVPGQEAEDMVSVATGLPYRDLPNAFLHRDPRAERPQGCGCQATASTGGYQVIGGQYRDTMETSAIETVIPTPMSRPDPAEDPETLANREGGLDLGSMIRLGTPPAPPREDGPATAASDLPPPGERRVRVVGPTFFPVQEEAIDLRVPAPGLAR